MEFTQAGIIFRTEKYEVCVAFYRDVLRLPILFQLSRVDSILTSFDLGSTYLMVEPGGPAPSHRKSLDQSPITLRFNVVDVEKTAVALEACDVTVNRRQSEDSRFLIPRHIEEAREMPSGDCQHVSGAQAVIVVAHIGVLILQQHHVRFA